MLKRLVSMLFGVVFLTSAGFAQTASSDDVAHRFYARLGMAGAFYHSSTTLAIFGQTVPGANAVVSNNATVTFDLGYNFTNNFSVDFFTGFPPKPSLTAEGTIAPYGTLGSIRYGPNVLAAQYHVRHWKTIQPYFGAGPAYTIVVENINGAITGLKVYNHFGFTMQTGADYMITKKWGLYADFKQTILALNARGNISGAPGTAHITVNPSVISVGLLYNFR